MIQHLAVIMDGNRRWAKKNGLMPWQGHKSGSHALRELIKFSREQDIKYLTVYALSLENLNRSETEIKFLLQLLIDWAQENLADLIHNEVKINFVGDQTKFPESVKSTILDLQNKTSNLDKLTLTVLFCYGGQQEIVAAAKQIAQDVKSGKLDPAKIDEKTFESYLWSNSPEPDLIIRTGEHKRLSNFLLFKAAYSELYFIDKLWPEMNKQDFQHALEEYKTRKRQFGV